MAKNYVVFGNHRWSKRAFGGISQLPGGWFYLTEMDEKKLRQLKPRYIFFMHWSDKVPEAVINAYECVGFHMTDLPYGRGGSPLQNLILRGFTKTKLTAFKMTPEFDTGPVYYKEDMSLDGTAGEIYERAAFLSAQLIRWIVRDAPVPTSQTGNAVIFKRRVPAESKIPKFTNTRKMYDFIRMLDADDYPKAFIEWEGFRYEFFAVSGCDEKSLFATVKICKMEKIS